MILLALALLASSPSDAAPAATATPVSVTVPAAKPVDDLDKVVCHIDPETGTRLGTHKECHTKREWIQNQTDEARYLDKNESMKH